MTDDDIHAELQELLAIVASTKAVGEEYTANLRVWAKGDQAFADIATVIDGTLEIIEHLTEMVIKQDQLLQMHRPQRGRLERVH